MSCWAFGHWNQHSSDPWHCSYLVLSLCPCVMVSSRLCVGCWIHMISSMMARFLASSSICHRISELERICKMSEFCCINCFISGCSRINCIIGSMLDRRCWMLRLSSICAMFSGQPTSRCWVCTWVISGSKGRADWNIPWLFSLAFLFQ